jgi:hypothetical protein
MSARSEPQETPPQTPPRRPHADGIFYDDVGVVLSKVEAVLLTFVHSDMDRSEDANVMRLRLAMVALDYTEESIEMLDEWWDEGKPR